jgi:UDP-N-acetylglucosamine 2-epimerase (non-hydrolysing)
LRSGDNYQPWPEEVNRKIVSHIADLHFAPTQHAADALIVENVAAERIHVTGNTVIDALIATQARIAQAPELASGLDGLAVQFAGKKLIAVTAHRRENAGEGMANIANALVDIATRDDVAIIFPVHPNPEVRAVMEGLLGGIAKIALISPLDYPHFVRLLSMADIVLTDSGGVQEEAPALGKPVLVMRDTTERPEGVAAGTAKLVGTRRVQIVAETLRLLDDKAAYTAMAQAHNPYGDGRAAQKIAQIIAGDLRPA